MIKMINFTDNPLFGLLLCILAYQAGIFISKRTKSPLMPPLLAAIILCVAVIYIFKIPLEHFNKGASLISLFLSPATAALAISVYRSAKLLKENLLPIAVGCTVGSLSSMGCVYLMCRLFKLDEAVTASLIPKSVTTPIAMGVAESLGGVPPIAVAAVLVTGITGAVSAPFLIKLFRSKSAVEAGLSIGACSHALGTTKALEIGEAEGAMSSVAIGICGLVTVFFSALIM